MASSEHMLPQQWRHRDPVVELRVGRKRPGNDTTRTAAPRLSARFDVKTGLNRIRRDKVQEIHAAFDAAATTVVNAVRTDQSPTHLPPPLSSDLPASLSHWDELLDSRSKAFDRARTNKKSGGGGGSSSATDKSSSSTAPKRSAVKASNDTPKSSSGVMSSADSRYVNSRAVLCTAASMAFDTLSPSFDDKPLDPLKVPQATAQKKDGTAAVNMGAVSLQAQTLANRAATLASNAARRADQRHQFRVQNAKADGSDVTSSVSSSFANIDEAVEVPTVLPTDFDPNPVSVTRTWETLCGPRLQAVLNTGSGHALICDTEWPTRHGRVAHMLENALKDRLGPHLIVTTQPDVTKFAQEFHPMDPYMPWIPAAPLDDDSGAPLKALAYTGTKQERQGLRKYYFSKANGLSNASFHVLVTTYEHLFDDFMHFCHIPFQTTTLDGGYSWLAAAQTDPNSSIGALWEQVFSSQDHHVGMAGTHLKNQWDFSSDTPTLPGSSLCLGLTTRHRILTTSSMRIDYRESRNLSPEHGLLNFFMPNFMDVVKEEWDRSRITQDASSMNFIGRELLARCMVVHSPSPYGEMNNLYKLAALALKGDLKYVERPSEATENVPAVFTDDNFVADGKVSQSRRSALLWFGKQPTSWMRYEFGTVNLKAIISILKQTGGHICQELVTASYLTSSGASGNVTGTMAYRAAVRCGRSFGSEQGLRQHQAAHHAPPGTWLCRTCGADCVTSQSRTHHERTCGHPGDHKEGDGNSKSSSKKPHGPVSVVGKKAKGQKKESAPKEKDPDGSFRVPGYRGVWLNPSGKHFVKIKGQRLKANGSLVLFDDVAGAAKRYDEALKDTSPAGKGKREFNFDSGGKRIVYDGNAAASAAGRGVEMIGGGSSSVVPALSVINIKDLPPHIKPLLRDPRQTSRTGGNSKRHVYAYRGVCRQARKGHDRWQSQISFGGTNHYLGTFDSEYDAAAIYAWAHLILYGEEATAKAQKEGEEAAAAYEKEKAAIAAGEILPKPPKPEKPKKAPAKRGSTGGKRKKPSEDGKDKSSGPPAVKRAKGDGISLLSVFAKGVTKAPVLGPRAALAEKTDDELLEMAMERLEAVRRNEYAVTDGSGRAEVEPELKPCSNSFKRGCAMFLGLSPTSFGWSVENVADYQDSEELYSALSAEYDSDGYNERFKSVMQGTVCMIGRASAAMEQACESIGISQLPLGGTVGNIDCHIGGVLGSCTTAAAGIQCQPATSEFHLVARNNDDIVTVNGKRITADTGSFPLFNEDICSVGSRVFVFLLPTDA
uniref:AP2/ERF domain-containing protein n=1 Tax=Grammatophora oceanica TaxID=210454 RepID=A0A7S1UWH9_9STRA|mmetsp:Transcript_26680/g.38997  ORF Transcript_26680/g.38997 Transcript_26680/m.38997 type:complete len:1283 (+) Transcript_26680:95-3943(+)